jgi:hypothetical protein
MRSVTIGYALLHESDDEMFIGSVIKGMREKCSEVYYDYVNDGRLSNAINLAAKIMGHEVEEIWLISPERLPQESLFLTVTDPILEQVFQSILESLSFDFQCGGFIPLCIRDEREGDSDEILKVQKDLKNVLKQCVGAFEANLTQMIKFEEESENLKVHYLCLDAAQQIQASQH